jgi:hypothetical protein
MSIPPALPLTKSHKKSKEKELSKHKLKAKDGSKKRKERQKDGHDGSEERVKKKSKPAKGKERTKHNQHREGEELVKTTSCLDLSLPPYYTNSPLSGAISVLDGLVMRWIFSLQLLYDFQGTYSFIHSVDLFPVCTVYS